MVKWGKWFLLVEFTVDERNDNDKTGNYEQIHLLA